MPQQPQSGEEAMDYLFGLLRKAAADAGRPVGEQCTDKFKFKNLESFDQRFRQGRWPRAQPKLELIASLHGAMSAYVSRLKEPDESEVSLAVFEAVGHLIREQYCPPGDPSFVLAESGDWCAWP